MAEMSTQLKDYPSGSKPVETPRAEPNPTRTDASGKPVEDDLEIGPPAPGIYGAKGDPYVYQVNEDDTVTVVEPSGKTMTLGKGSAFDAIRGQIKSGVLSMAGNIDDVVPQRALDARETRRSGVQAGKNAYGEKTINPSRTDASGKPVAPPSMIGPRGVLSRSPDNRDPLADAIDEELTDRPERYGYRP